MSAVLAQAATFVGPEVQWFALSPILVLLGGALFLLVASALVRKSQASGSYAAITCTTAGAAFVLSAFLWDDVREDGAKALVGGALVLDGFSLFVTMIICASVLLASLLADDYLRREQLETLEGAEFQALLLLCGLGAVIMASSSDLIVMFLGLETLSVGLYVMAAAHLRRLDSQEAAIKYFVLGGFSSAFFLYGVALIYGATGSTNMAFIADVIAASVPGNDRLLYAGMALLLVGLAFKVAAVPFHSWAPDVYTGSPTPATGFMASAAKAAAFAAFLRVFTVMLDAYSVDWRPAIWVIAVATLLLGSIVSVVQTNTKRMLAYSSISHAGFILVALESGTTRGTEALLFYLAAYSVMAVGSFGILTIVGTRGDDQFALDDLRGLSRRRPVLAFGFTVLLLSQAGVPLTSGFMAKFGVIVAAVDAGSYAIAIIAMLAAVVAAFVYLRIIVSMYMSDSEDVSTARIPMPVSGVLAVAITVGFTLAVGFYPTWLLDTAKDAVPFLVR